MYDFFNSTKFPIFELSSIILSGLILANGPISTLFFITAFSIWLNDFIVTLFPIFTFDPNTTYGSTVTFFPNVVSLHR